METHALLLANREEAETQLFAKILNFFGVDCCSVRVQQLLADYRGLKDRDSEISHKTRILCSVETLLDLIRQMEMDPKTIEWWQTNTHSVFVYAGNAPHLVERFVRMATGDKSATVDRGKMRDKNI